VEQYVAAILKMAAVENFNIFYILIFAILGH